MSPKQSFNYFTYMYKHIGSKISADYKTTFVVCSISHTTPDATYQTKSKLSLPHIMQSTKHTSLLLASAQPGQSQPSSFMRCRLELPREPNTPEANHGVGPLMCMHEANARGSSGVDGGRVRALSKTCWLF